MQLSLLSSFVNLCLTIDAAFCKCCPTVVGPVFTLLTLLLRCKIRATPAGDDDFFSPLCCSNCTTVSLFVLDGRELLTEELLLLSLSTKGSGFGRVVLNTAPVREYASIINT